MAIKFRRVKRRARKNAAPGMNLGLGKSPLMAGAAIVGGIFLVRYLMAKKAATAAPKALPAPRVPTASGPAPEDQLQGIGGGIFKGGF